MYKIKIYVKIDCRVQYPLHTGPVKGNLTAFFPKSDRKKKSKNNSVEGRCH